MQKTELAWLAGFWDGEGSIGLTKSGTTFLLNAQLSHTDIASIKEIFRILKKYKIQGRGYTYQERNPAKHRDAHYIRITGMNNVRCFCELLLPYSITKKRHFEIAIEWAEKRIEIAGGVNERGHLFRGYDAKKRQYTEADKKLYFEMRALNARGPEVNKTFKRGRIEGL